MADDIKPREHYIPVRKSELVSLLCDDRCLTTGEPLSPEDRDGFRRFCDIISAVFHFEFHSRLERLKDDYAPFDPDADTRPLRPVTDERRRDLQEKLFTDLGGLLEKANYSRLTPQEIEDATEAVSAWGLNMDVDLDAFEHIEVWIRGKVKGKRTLRRLWNFYRAEEVEVAIYQRVVTLLKQKQHKRFGKDADTKSIFLKVFKDIPRADLEMLLPGTRVKMPTTDRAKLGGSILSAVGLIGYQMLTKFWDIIHALLVGTFNVTGIVFGPLALILGYGYKQYSGYQQQKVAYTLKLAQSLYYQSLDGNAGVLFRLLDEAEEQECREAILAYFYLWRYASQRPEGWDAASLDAYAEMDLARRAGVEVDFEIEDALHKLARLGLLEANGDRFKAVPLTQALETLDGLWDNYFTYHNAAAGR